MTRKWPSPSNSEPNRVMKSLCSNSEPISTPTTLRALWYLTRCGQPLRVLLASICMLRCQLIVDNWSLVLFFSISMRSIYSTAAWCYSLLYPRCGKPLRALWYLTRCGQPLRVLLVSICMLRRQLIVDNWSLVLFFSISMRTAAASLSPTTQPVVPN
jgi:hypothetical protein